MRTQMSIIAEALALLIRPARHHLIIAAHAQRGVMVLPVSCAQRVRAEDDAASSASAKKCFE
jgi:hypothetical protein